MPGGFVAHTLYASQSVLMSLIWAAAWHTHTPTHATIDSKKIDTPVEIDRPTSRPRSNGCSIDRWVGVGSGSF